MLKDKFSPEYWDVRLRGKECELVDGNGELIATINTNNSYWQGNAIILGNALATHNALAYLHETLLTAISAQPKYAKPYEAIYEAIHEFLSLVDSDYEKLMEAQA